MLHLKLPISYSDAKSRAIIGLIINKFVSIQEFTLHINKSRVTIHSWINHGAVPPEMLGLTSRLLGVSPGILNYNHWVDLHMSKAQSFQQLVRLEELDLDLEKYILEGNVPDKAVVLKKLR